MAVSQSLTLTEKSYSVANNTSTVRLLWTSTQTGQSHNDYTKTASYTINGTTYNVSYTLPANTTRTIVDKDFTIKHNDDGTKTVYASTKMDTGISAGTIEKSASLTLTAIPRASTISATDANIGASTTITITKSNTDFKSTVYYSLDGGTTKTKIIDKTANKQIAWTIPDAFYAKIPNVKSGKIYLYVDTFNGSTQVGSQQSCSITASVVENDCKPQISCTVQDVDAIITAITGDANIIVLGKSDAQYNMTVTPRKSATIVSKTIQCGNDKQTTTTGSFANAASNKFTITAKDSRGITTTQTITKPVVNYTPLSGTVAGEAPDVTTGESTITANGKWFNGDIGATTNTIDVQFYAQGEGAEAIGLPEPTLTINGDEWTATVDATGLDYRTAWTFIAITTDALGSDVWYSERVNAVPVFDWGAEDFNFNVPVHAPSLTLDSPWQSVTFTANSTNVSSAPATVKYCPMLGIGMIRVYATSNKSYNSGYAYTIGSIAEHLPTAYQALACYNAAGNADARITTDGNVQVFAHSTCASGYDFIITGIFFAGGD